MTLLRRFRAGYGAGPLHLLTLLASFAIAGAAVAGWFERPGDVETVLVWFAAAIVIHDLVLLPLYSLLDRIAFRRWAEPRKGAQHMANARRVNPTPYIRIPAILSGLLLLVFFPVIFGLGAQTELAASGIAESGYLARWLLATGVMFAVSGASYAVAAARAGAPPQSSHPELEGVAPSRGSTAPDAGPDQMARDAGPDQRTRDTARDQTVRDATPEPNQTAQDPAEAAAVPGPPEPAETAVPSQPEPAEPAPGDAPGPAQAPE